MADKTQIAPDTHIKGKLEGEDALDVFGSIEGELHLTNTLTLGQQGRLKGTIHVTEAIIEGQVEGHLEATDRIVLLSTARVVATLSAPIIRMDDGAHVRGEVIMDIDGAPVVRQKKQERPVKVSATVPARPKPVERPVSKPAPVSTPSNMATQTTTTTTTTVVVDEEPPPEPSKIDPPKQSKVKRATPEPQPLEEPTEIIEEIIEEPPVKDVASPEVEAPEVEQIAEISEPEEVESEEHPFEPDPEEIAKYDHYTVKELREELRRMDLPISGTKTELVYRLIEESQN